MTSPRRPRPSARPTLPAERAFVVQLRADAAPALGNVRGRLEHLRSGRVALFDSIDELVAAMEAVLGGEGRKTKDERRKTKDEGLRTKD